MSCQQDMCHRPPPMSHKVSQLTACTISKDARHLSPLTHKDSLACVPAQCVLSRRSIAHEVHEIMCGAARNRFYAGAELGAPLLPPAEARRRLLPVNPLSCRKLDSNLMLMRSAACRSRRRRRA